jgi:hypothetical protein
MTICVCLVGGCRLECNPTRNTFCRNDFLTLLIFCSSEYAFDDFWERDDRHCGGEEWTSQKSCSQNYDACWGVSKEVLEMSHSVIALHLIVFEVI